MILFVIWLISTQSGLNALIWGAKILFPIHFHFKKAEGSVLEGLKLQKVQVTSEEFSLEAESLSFKPKLFPLLYNNIEIDEIYIQNGELDLKNIKNIKNEDKDNHSENNIQIKKGTGAMLLQMLGNSGSFIINNVEGIWQNKSFKGFSTFNIKDGQLQVQELGNTEFILGENKFQWTHTKEKLHDKEQGKEQDNIQWQIEWGSFEPGIFVIAEGKLGRLGGEISKLHLNVEKEGLLGEWEIKSPTPYTVSSKAISIPTLLFKNTALNFGSKNKATNLAFSSGSTLDFQIDNFAVLNPHKNPSLEGTIHAELKDLRILLPLIPEMARPQGLLNIQVKIKGTPDNPNALLDAHLQDGLFYLPKDRIKIKNLNFALTGDLFDKIIIRGTGNSGDGEFKLTGYVEPFSPNIPNQLILKGKDLRMHNTTDAYIIASPNLSLEYKDDALFVEGTVHIPQGFLYQQDQTNFVRSNDVVVKSRKNSDESENDFNANKSSTSFNIVPDVTFKIDEGFHYKGNNLDATVSGNLRVTQRGDGFYEGNGRLTIVEGKYRVKGVAQYIRRGRLLFVPGTLLANPILDIKIVPRSVLEQKESTEVGLYVQGTLQKPVIELFSTGHLQESEILNRLGYGIKEPESGNARQDARQLAAQSAKFVASGTANPIIEKLQNNFGIEEFNVESKETQRSLNTMNTLGGSSNTVLVLGKSLTKKLYLQFIQGLLEPTSTIRLKYSLNPNWSASVEKGTDGTGADLTFSTESD